MAAVAEQTKGLRRAMPARLSRAETIGLRESQNGPPRVCGHFIVWDEWAEIKSIVEGHFFERMARGCADKTIRENSGRFRCLFQHGEDPVIGRKVLGPIDVLEQDDIGIYYEVPLLDTKYNEELLPGLREGLYGSSVSFDALKWNRVTRPSRSDRNPDGIEERTITELRIVEFGPCLFQWYEGATASARSETDAAIIQRLSENPEMLQEAARRAGIVVDGSRAASVDSSVGKAYIDVVPRIDSASWTSTSNTESVVASGRRYQRAAQAVGDTMWACTPAHLAVIQAIIEERQRGYKPNQDEIEARIGDGKPAPDSGKKGDIALIPVGGTIMPHGSSFGNVSQSGTSVENLQAMFRDSMNDSSVEAIVFNIDSPGGAVDLVPEFAAEVRAARGKKPIYALANTMAASAAYWIASAADEIYVTPSGKVGSIGVYSAHKDVSGEQQQKGIKTTLVSAGEYKVDGNPFEPLSKSAREEMQKTVDTYYGMFVNAVADGRGVDAETVKSEYGKGRLLTAKDAVDAGLADGVATLDELLLQIGASSDTLGDTNIEPVAEDDIAATTPEPERPVATTRPPVEDEAGWIYGQRRTEERWTM